MMMVMVCSTSRSDFYSMRSRRGLDFLVAVARQKFVSGRRSCNTSMVVSSLGKDVSFLGVGWGFCDLGMVIACATAFVDDFMVVVLV